MWWWISTCPTRIPWTYFLFLNAERAVCQVIDRIYASILQELHNKNDLYKDFETLSALLAKKVTWHEQERVRKHVLEALFRVANLSSLAVTTVKRMRNSQQRHDDQACGKEQAREAVASYLKYWNPLIRSPSSIKKVWPVLNKDHLRMILERMNTLLYSS